MSNINEISILKILYKNKVRLLLAILLVGVVTAIITWLFPNTYSSTAAITVRQPEVTLTGEVPPLNVETLRALVESTRVKWELFQELKKQSVLDDEATFQSFQRRLSSSVESDRSRERNLLPMVKLTATTGDSELSMVIANRWSEVVLKKTKGIYQSGVDELGTFTANIYEEVNKSLLESEDRYTATLLESNLSVNKMLLKQNGELYSRISTEVLNLGEEVATRTALLNKLKENLAEQEIDGVWIGGLFSRKYSEDKKYVLPVATALAERITRTIRSLEKVELALAEFEKSSRVDYKQMVVKIKKQQIEDISREIMTARTALFGSEPTYNKLTEELAKIDPKISLSKAIADDILWTVYLQGNMPNVEKLPTLKTESSNPVYQETKKEIVALSGEINGLNNKIAEGKKELEMLRKEVSELTRDIVSLEAKRAVLRTASKKDRDLMAYFEKAYNEDRQGYESEDKELVEMEVKLSAKKIELAAIEKNIAGLEKSVFTSEGIIARQKRNVDNLTKVRASLATKAEEVALLRVTMESVSRSGTVLLYQAQADPIKVGPRRARTVLISMLLAFLLASFLLVVNTVVREG